VDGIIAHLAVTIATPGGSHCYGVPRQLLNESISSYSYSLSPAGLLTVSDARTDKIIMNYSPSGWLNVDNSN
jgi:hypothetical protein